MNRVLKIVVLAAGLLVPRLTLAQSWDIRGNVDSVVELTGNLIKIESGSTQIVTVKSYTAPVAGEYVVRWCYVTEDTKIIREAGRRPLLFESLVEGDLIKVSIIVYRTARPECSSITLLEPKRKIP